MKSGGTALVFKKGDSVKIPSLNYDGGPLTVELTMRGGGTAFASFGKSKAVLWGGGGALSGVSLDVGASTVVAREQNSRLTVTEPHRIAAVFDGERLLYFIDGKLQSLGVASPQEAKAPSGTYIGGLVGVLWYEGVLDEVRVSNVVRYAADYAPKDRFDADANTLALYHFDEGQGDKLTDSSGHQHHGQIVGAKWVRTDLGTGDLKSQTSDLKSPAPPPAKAPFDAQQARTHQEAWSKHLGVPVEKEVELPGGAKINFMLIPPGEFMMGSSKDEQEHFIQRLEETPVLKTEKIIIRLEEPQHPVRITRPFYLARLETTQALWESVMGMNPAKWPGTDRPVEHVSWDDIQSFLTKLNSRMEMAGMKFILPSEAQWEHACRAGTTTRWFWGDDEAAFPEFAWCNKNEKPERVGLLKPNAWGLHDMLGNVQEWCANRGGLYPSSLEIDSLVLPTETTEGHAFRGGSRGEPLRHCRSASRGGFNADYKGIFHGFRLVAKKHQEAWAKHLGTTVETTNSVGAKMILIPPGEFLMGSTASVLKALRAEGGTGDSRASRR